MFKKQIALMLAVCMLFCLSACGKTDTDNKINPTQATKGKTEESAAGTTESTKAPTEEPTNTQPEEPTNKPDETPTTDPTPTSCSHSYQKATCTTPQTCSKCGVTTGSALGHSYKDATCTAAKTCTKCGVTEGVALEHRLENGICVSCQFVDEDKYVEAQVKAAEAAFVDYTNYEDALDIIKAALQKCPQNKVLVQKRDYYSSFAPVDLCNLTPYKKSYGYLSNSGSSDNLGNEYEKTIYKSHYNSSVSGTYDLSYKYNSLTATVFMRNDCSRQVYGTIKIYGDNILLYQKNEIDVYGRPFEITVDVTGVLDLEIVIESESGAYVFGLANCVLQRTVK